MLLHAISQSDCSIHIKLNYLIFWQVLFIFILIYNNGYYLVDVYLVTMIKVGYFYFNICAVNFTRI